MTASATAGTVSTGATMDQEGSFTLNDETRTAEFELFCINFIPPVFSVGPPHSVSYGCVAVPNTEPDERTAVALGFTRQCTAELGAARQECYDMMGAPDPAFEGFVEAVDQGTSDCENPRYIYNIFYGYSYSQLGYVGDPDFQRSIGSSVYNTPGSSTDEFNATLALFTMNASLEVERTFAPTASPTSSPTEARTGQPTVSEDSGGDKFLNGWFWSLLLPLFIGTGMMIPDYN